MKPRIFKRASKITRKWIVQWAIGGWRIYELSCETWAEAVAAATPDRFIIELLKCPFAWQ